MDDVKFIKLYIDFMNDGKIKQIRKMPAGNDIAFIWLLLLCLAGKTNDNGMLYLTEAIPYNEEMLSVEFDYDVTTIRLALKVFQNFGMIELVDNVIWISNWSKYQNVDALDKVREQGRLRQQKYRAKLKMLSQPENEPESFENNDKQCDTENFFDDGCSDCNVTSDVTVTQSNAPRNKKEDIRNKNNSNKETDCCEHTDVERIVEEWNSLEAYGINPVSRISKTSARYKNLCARLKEYTPDEIVAAIRNVESSDFLKGKNNKGWRITFDWFVLPNNFLKVFEGNYTGGKKKPPRRDDLDDIM